MRPKSVEEFARALGIADAQLQRLRIKYRREHGKEGEAKLLKWLQKTEREMRDVVRIPARQNGLLQPPQYVEHPAGGLDQEPEAPDHDEISGYRESKQAAARFAQERAEDASDVFAACRELRSAIDSMPKERKKAISRTLWTLRGRLDALERDLRRQIAA